MAERISLSYSPPGETLRAFCASDALARALIGPLHGGRERCAVHDIVRRAYHSSQRRWRWLAVRQRMSDLEEETISHWHEVVPAGAAIGAWDPKGLTHKVGLATTKGKPIDIEIQFLALDRTEHRQRYATARASAVWLDGADEVEERVFTRALELAGSWPQDEPPVPLVIMTGLMPSEDHWLQKNSEVTLFRQPGGRTPYAENMASRTPPGDNPEGHYQRLAKNRSPEWVKTYVDAEWATDKGKRSLAQLIAQSYEIAA
jgi:hypothetical protein